MIPEHGSKAVHQGVHRLNSQRWKAIVAKFEPP